MSESAVISYSTTFKLSCIKMCQFAPITLISEIKWGSRKGNTFISTMGCRKRNLSFRISPTSRFCSLEGWLENYTAISSMRSWLTWRMWSEEHKFCVNTNIRRVNRCLQSSRDMQIHFTWVLLRKKTQSVPVHHELRSYERAPFTKSCQVLPSPRRIFSHKDGRQILQ
jgi:hypothetical protein